MAKKRIVNWRRHFVQLVYAAATNGYAAGFLKGGIFTGSSKIVCVPGLNCYSCPGAFMSCPIGATQAVIGDRRYSVSFYMIGFFLIIGAALGRLVCGFLCPFGLAQDLINKIPFVKKYRGLPGEKYLRKLKYFILAGFVILLPLLAVDILGQGSPWFCKYICPSGTLFAGIPLVALNESLQDAAGSLFAWKLGLLIVLLVLSVIVFRPFCRYLCPLGAIYGMMNKVSSYRLRVDQEACIDCGACERACPMQIPTYKTPNSAECIRCGICMQVCPTNAISSTWRSGKKKCKKECVRE